MQDAMERRTFFGLEITHSKHGNIRGGSIIQTKFSFELFFRLSFFHRLIPAVLIHSLNTTRNMDASIGAIYQDLSYRHRDQSKQRGGS